MWHKQAIIEYSRQVISIVACCHGAKLCAYVARDFRSQHNCHFSARQEAIPQDGWLVQPT